MSNRTATERLLEEALRELQEAPGVEVSDQRVGEIPAEHEDVESELAALSEAAGTTLGPEFKTTLCRFEEISVCWELDSTDLRGEFSVESLRYALAHGPHEHPLEGELTSAERQRWSEFRPFDGHPVTGTGEWVALRIRPGTPNPEIWYYHTETENYAGFELDLDYHQYLRTLAITKGTYGWQKLFCDVDVLTEDDMSEVRTELEEMLELLPPLFPGHDYAPLRARLAERS